MTTVTMVQEHRELLPRLKDKISQIDWYSVFNGTCGFIGATTFGIYSVIFAMIGGIFWLWAVPYALLALLCGGFTIYSFAHTFG